MKSGRDQLQDQMRHAQDRMREQQQQDQARRQQAQQQSAQRQQQMIQQQQQQMQRGVEEARRRAERAREGPPEKGEPHLLHGSDAFAGEGPGEGRLLITPVARRQGHPFLAILLVLVVLALLACGALTTLAFTLPGMVVSLALVVVTLVVAPRLWGG